MEKNKKTLGQYGEDVACEYLIKQGYKILERNKHFSRACEIDIIAKHKSTYVFVEVKTRSSSFCGDGFEAITSAKYKNIKTGLLIYVKEHNIKNYRIDAVSVQLKPELTIKHLQNI